VQVIFLMERNYRFGKILQSYMPAELVSKLRSWRVCSPLNVSKAIFFFKGRSSFLTAMTCNSTDVSGVASASGSS